MSVPIPRCRACLVGARNVAGLFAALPMLALAVGFGAVHSQLSGLGWDADPDPLTDPMGDFLVFLGGLIGWIGGFYLFITIVCRVLGATRKRPKADKRFPLVAALLARRMEFSGHRLMISDCGRPRLGIGDLGATVRSTTGPE